MSRHSFTTGTHQNGPQAHVVEVVVGVGVGVGVVSVVCDTPPRRSEVVDRLNEPQLGASSFIPTTIDKLSTRPLEGWDPFEDRETPAVVGGVQA